MLMALYLAMGELSKLRGEPNQQQLYCFTLSPSFLTAQNRQSSIRTKPGASSGGPQHPLVPEDFIHGCIKESGYGTTSQTYFQFCQVATCDIAVEMFP